MFAFDLRSVLRLNGTIFGPIISHDLAKMICSVPSLKDVSIDPAYLHSDFYAVLAKEGNKSKVSEIVMS